MESIGGITLVHGVWNWRR